MNETRIRIHVSYFSNGNDVRHKKKKLSTTREIESCFSNSQRIQALFSTTLFMTKFWLYFSVFSFACT